MKPWRIEDLETPTNADRVFPTNVVRRWLPSYAQMGGVEAAQEFYLYSLAAPEPLDSPTAWGRHVGRLFHRGGLIARPEDRKPGVSEATAHKAVAIVAACLRSFEPKHKHKITGCAWILSQFFTRPPVPLEKTTEDDDVQ